MNPTLVILCMEIGIFIREIETAFAPLVLADFRDGLNTLPDETAQISYCRKWLRMYCS